MRVAVFVREFDTPRLDTREILRYLGCREESEKTEALIDECLAMSLPTLCYKVCSCELALRLDGKCVTLGSARVESQALAARLAGCERAVVFAATVGFELDRLISKYSRLSPARAVCLQAIGAERVEALCDAFCLSLGEKYSLRPRFSPGYGDLSLELQRHICELLFASKHIGVGVNESLLLSPSKSVTAIVGIEK